MKRKGKEKKGGSKATTKRKATTKSKATTKRKATTGAPTKATSEESFQQYIARNRAERREAEAQRQRLYRTETKKRALAHAKRIRAFETSVGKSHGK